MNTSRSLLAHLLVPAVVAIWALGMALRREPLGAEVLVAHLASGLAFYAAPHLLWAALCSALRPSRSVRHVGFAACSLALGAVCALAAFGPRDPSGLPYQWLVYWPLAGTALAVVLVGWVVAGRPRAAA